MYYPYIPHLFLSWVPLNSLLQVNNLIGYAVGEVMTPSLQERQDGDEEGVVIRWRPNKMNCYEVVTSWIHPK